MRKLTRFISCMLIIGMLGMSMPVSSISEVNTVLPYHSGKLELR